MSTTSHSCLALLFFLFTQGLHAQLPPQEGYLNEPYLEWELTYADTDSNRYDVVAHAVFTHEDGEVKRSLMYYAGEDTYRFRFTGTKLGRWDITTEGPGALGNQTGVVQVKEAPEVRRGFLVPEASRWVWAGTGEEHVPQLLMSKALYAYWKDGTVDTVVIDQEVQEFIVETGFTGFHKASIGAAWFDVIAQDDDTDQTGPEATPDPRSFQVLEAFIIRAYQAGASTHLWLWGSDSYKVGWGSRSGPDGIGGPMSVADQRLNRYIAARLGPIPGWSLGYGYDLEAYTDVGKLQTWYEYLKGHLREWEHLIGGRGDEKDTWDRKLDPDRDGHPGISYRNEMRAGPHEIFWTGGDYIGLYDYRVPYRWYVETLEFGQHRNKPVLQEDRFRIRNSDKWFVKDYTPELTRRGFWHAMMAGGVGNIWGAYLPNRDQGGSRPYDTQATGSVQDVEFMVDIKDALKAWHDFWYARGVFRSDYRRANELTQAELGPAIWDTSPTQGYICIGLKSPDEQHYVFYTENASSITMDLRDMQGDQPVMVLDTRTGEMKELSPIAPGRHESFDLGHRSDWAIAVGSYEASPPTATAQ